MQQEKDPKSSNVVFLTPSHETLDIKGKLLYSEGSQAWNIIRLKKEILREFPQLKEKRSKFSYKMIVPKSYSDVKVVIENFEGLKVIPILLLFCRDIEG